MSSILISRAIPRKAVASAVVAGGSAYIAQTSYRQYATAKKAPHSLPGAMTFTDALNVLKAKEVSKPNHLIEVHIQTNTKAEKHSQPIRTSVLLQKAIKQDSVILVFAEGAFAEQARAAGATIVGGPELVKEVEDGKHKFDKCISTPGMYPSVTKLARILGPKGLMPTTKKGTVTEDIAGVIKAQTAAFDVRGDKTGVVHTIIGKVDWDQNDIEANYQIIMDQMKVLAQERFVKKDWIKNVYISSTQGPGIPLINNI
ncbi:large subunit ribosomal protein L1 [Entomortierella parvispora]|uniref:Large subunit ribosomal protein L1 n=1 Tax=Entomortierella parvispora TaxID=205924 RepID=A0A9P3HDA0_9FUNG|nr:large subunit ribosomal protein L1 [Entomortierella parvispora]